MNVTRDHIDQGLSPRTRVLALDATQPSLTIQAHGIGDVHHRQHRIDALTHPDTVMPIASLGKPPYRVPLMAELAAIPPNGLTVASTFSGCGGSCLGYRMAGYRVVWASEFVPIACESYRANAPETILDTRDIRTVQADEILAATGLARGELDLFDGSPPCQPFSTAGKREKSWGKIREYGDHSQRADDLFFEYVRLVDGLQPRVFVAENVSGLVKGTAKGYFKQILSALKACGYVVQAKLLDAQWLGVPQARQRIIFVGVRNDLGLLPAFPSPLPYRYSVRDALPWIDGIQVGRDDFRSSVRHPSPTILASDGARSTSTLDCPIGMVEIEGANGFNGHAGASVDQPAWTPESSRPVGLQTTLRAYRDDRGAFGNGGDCTETPAPTVLAGSVGTHWIEGELGTYQGSRTSDLPAPTIQTHGNPKSFNELAVVISPVERRKFTIAELRRICAFPDDFVLCGSYAEQWARLGNAVPPVMMQHIAATIRDEILLPGRL